MGVRLFLLTLIALNVTTMTDSNAATSQDVRWVYDESSNGNPPLWSSRSFTTEELIAKLTNTKQPKIRASQRIKHSDEEGDFYFAKDYRQLSDVVESQNEYGVIYFSNRPMNDKYEGAKTQFTSAEPIYAKLVLKNGATIKDVFKLADKLDDRPLAAIHYRVHLYYNGKMIAENNRGRYLLLRGDSKTGNTLSFDIKPNPSTITSVYTEDYYPGGMVSAFLPFYDLYMSNNGRNFRESGAYQVQVLLYNIPVDAFGNADPKQRREIMFGFEYKHDEGDLETIVQNSNDATAAMKALAYSTDKIPDVFHHPVQVADLSYDRIKAILKRDMPWATIMKVAIGPGSGPEWEVEKDKLGLPRQKWFNRKIHIIYKHQDKCRIGTADLIQEYEGAGKYGELKLGYRSENDLLIDCALVK